MPMGEEAFSSMLRGAKEGAEWAWAALYRDLAGPVTGYLASRGAAEPEDLTSDVFLKVARNIHSFTGDESSFRSWVFVTAHRRLIDERRALSRRPVIGFLAGSLSSDPTGDVESEALENLATGELQAAFESLTEAQRDVLSLRIIAGLTLAETARVLGKRTGAVKALQRRALAALRGELDLENVTP